jgi:hypothetical protein
MKIRELLEASETRSKLRTGLEQGTPGLSIYHDISNNSKPYTAYRFGVAMAGSLEQEMSPHGPIGSDFTVIDYTKEDEKIRKAAEKMMGIKPTMSTGRGSLELNKVNSTSPVPDRNKLRK